MQHIIGRRGNKPIFAHIRQNRYLLKFKDHNQARQHLNVFVTNVPNLEGHLTCFSVRIIARNKIFNSQTSGARG